MPECLRCGHQAEMADRYCPHCGSSLQPELPAGAAPHDYAGGHYSSQQPPAAAAAAALPESKIIPIPRIALLTIATYGFYLFYWFYLTWRQYRDHTGDQAYPVCHALTLLIPIYAWFRIYGHGKAIQRLTTAAGLPDNVIPMLPVLLFLFANGIINVINILLEADWPLPPGPLFAAWFMALAYTALSFCMIWHLQKNLNLYWQAIEPPGLKPSNRVAVMEILLIIPGALGWFGLIGATFLTAIEPTALPEIPEEAVRLMGSHILSPRGAS